MRGRTDSGMTLIEVMIALVVTGVVFGFIMHFATNSLTAYSQTNIRAGLLDELQLGLDTINNDIRLSATADQNNRVSDTYAPGAPSNLFSWSSDSDTLVLASVVEDNNGNIIFSDASKYISYKNNTIYYLSGTTLYRRILAASVSGNSAITNCPAASSSNACPADRKIIENLQSFSASYRDGDNAVVAPDEARSIEITATAQDTLRGQVISVTATTRTVFRNE